MTIVTLVSISTAQNCITSATTVTVYTINTDRKVMNDSRNVLELFNWSQISVSKFNTDTYFNLSDCILVVWF